MSTHTISVILAFFPALSATIGMSLLFTYAITIFLPTIIGFFNGIKLYPNLNPMENEEKVLKKLIGAYFIIFIATTACEMPFLEGSILIIVLIAINVLVSAYAIKIGGKLLLQRIITQI